MTSPNKESIKSPEELIFDEKFTFRNNNEPIYTYNLDPADEECDCCGLATTLEMYVEDKVIEFRGVIYKVCTVADMKKLNRRKLK